MGENAVFIGVPVIEGAAAAEGQHPVILLSHGLGGRIETNAWLSAGLAARGAIVLSVNHPKSTSSDFDLRQAWEHWTRARDLQGVLDWLLDEPHWMPRVDGTRVAAVGYSVDCLQGETCATGVRSRRPRSPASRRRTRP